MTSLFDDIAQFDEGILASRREAVAVALKRVQDRVGAYLKIASSAEEYDARLDFVDDDIRQIVADVADEFSVDSDKLREVIEEEFKGDGITELNDELADAPSAVGEGTLSHTAGGHKPGCTCGFCKNKGNLPGRVDQEEQADKDASEPDETDETKESKTADVADPSYYMGGDEPPAAPLGQCQNCGAPLDQIASGANCPACGEPTISPQFQNSMDSLLPNNGDFLSLSSTKQADAPKDGGGATKTVDLPTGKGDAVGYGASPKIDKKEWKPNALNADGNLPAVPEGSEMSGSPNPTKQQDVDDKPDYEGDFLRDTDAVTTQQDLPSADETGQSKERNISQDGQSGTWTESQNDAVTSEVLSSADPDVNPLKAILDAGFTPDTQVESAIRDYQSE